MKRHHILMLTVIVFLFSCKKEVKDKSKANKKEGSAIIVKEDSVKFERLPYEEKLKRIKKYTPKTEVLSDDEYFINEKILKGRFKVNLNSYDTVRSRECFPDRLNRQEIIGNFEGFKNIGDIDKDKKDDYVFVLSPLNSCEEGQSYYFSNPKIPRIYSDSYCCHPESIFSIGDINEDGSNEIAEYYSSCASNFKTITIWTLKKNKWVEVKTFAYFYNNEYKVFEDFHKLSRKISKNKFSFLEISDMDGKGGLIKKWRTVTMK